MGNIFSHVRDRINEYFFYRKKRALFDTDVNVVCGDDNFRGRRKEVYAVYGAVVQKIFNPKQILDIGCANGYLLEYFLNNGVQDICGIEGADAAFPYMNERVVPKVFKLNLTRPISKLDMGDQYKKYMLVNCTEVGEHIPLKYESVFLDTITNLSAKYLVVSWANTWEEFCGFDKQQHVNPRSRKYVIQKIQSRGFLYKKDMTKRMISELRQFSCVPDHWIKNIMVYERLRREGV